KEFFKIYVKIGEIEKAKNIFKKNNDIKLGFFMGETFFKSLYFLEANSYFKNIIDSQSKFERKEIISMVDCFIITKENQLALNGIDYLLNDEPDDILLNLKKIDLVLSDTELLNKDFSFKDVRLKEYYVSKKEYVLKNDYSKYRDFLIINLKDKNIDDIYNQKILLELIKLEYDNKNYKEVLNQVSKISEKIVNSISPEFKFLLASSYLNLKDEQKALMEFLKIFYIYPYDNYRVASAIKEVLNIYEKNGDTEKYQKTLKMFEDKYFKMH
ncbi:MAG TPA: hypothetical protein PK771_11945, partial [Spirochaetota bacterium]|nr:hypothetical protein [Spirochaetota bacterium]